MENVNFKMLIKCICNLEKKEILYTVLKKTKQTNYKTKHL